ncbi:MAG: alpha/beta hydrolase [Dongiaceae bacterium]
MILDPQIERFAKALLAAGQGLDPAVLPLPELRRRAAEIRRPLNEGGPAMARRTEHRLQTGRGPLTVRILRPVEAPALPALVYLHGGGWTLLDLDTHDRLMRELAAASGRAVVGVDYPLAPEAPFPAAIEHVAALVRLLRRDGASLGLDPGRIALAGDSAGANLALGSALALRDAGDDPGEALLLAYGVYDCDLERPSYARFGDGTYPLTGPRMAWFWANYVPDPAQRRHPLASPCHADLAGLPPARLLIADTDVLLDENLALAGRLRAAGNRGSATVHLGTTHAFLEAAGCAAVARRAILDAGAWLRAPDAG